MSHPSDWYFNPVSSGPMSWTGVTLPVAQTPQEVNTPDGWPLNASLIGNGFLGYPPSHDYHYAPQGAHSFNIPAFWLQSTSLNLAQFPFNAPARNSSAGPSAPVGQVSPPGSSACQWAVHETVCGKTITERTIPRHLAEHGIRRMQKDCPTFCLWGGCKKPIKRQSIARHVREVHLKSKRKPSKCHALPETSIVLEDDWERDGIHL